MKPVNKPLVIFSVFQASKEDSYNKLAHENTKRMLSDIGANYIEALGVYKGSKELSLVIDAEFEGIAAMLAFEFKQESYLYLDSDRNAYFVSDNGSGTYVNQTFAGIFKAVPDNYNGDHTQNLLTGLKYAILK